jgi:hypothetical protein
MLRAAPSAAASEEIFRPGSGARSESSGTSMPSTNTMAGIDPGQDRAGGAASPFAAASGAQRGFGVPHQRAQVGVLPILDAAMRQPDRLEAAGTPPRGARDGRFGDAGAAPRRPR